MKKLAGFISLLLCLAMIFCMASCADTAEDEPDVQPSTKVEAPGSDQSGDEKVDPDVKKEPYSTYELTLLMGDWGTIIVNDYDSDGRVVKTKIKNDCDYYFGLVTNYMEHSYSDEGVLESTVVYSRDHTDIYGFPTVYEKYTEIKWTADDSGRIVSGRAQSSADFYEDIAISYHGDTAVISKVEMKEIGEPEAAFTVEYNEKGQKIYEEYDGDVSMTFVYTEGVLTGAREQDLHKKENGAVWTVKCDGEGRIMSTERAGNDGENDLYSYTYAESGDTVVGFYAKGSDGTDTYDHKVELTYDANDLLTLVDETYEETEDGESGGKYQYTTKFLRDGEGRVTSVSIADSCDGAVEREEEITVEYGEGKDFNATCTVRSLNGETEKLETVRGYTDSYTYDENGRCTENIYEQFDADGKVTERCEYRFAYDERGNCAMNETVRYDGEGKIRSKNKNEFEYNEDLTVGKHVSYTFDENGEANTRSVIEYEYYADYTVKTKTETVYRPLDTVRLKLIYEYNEKGEKVVGTEINYSDAGVKSSYEVYIYAYYEDGKKKLEDNISYDANDVMKRRVVREYEYDEYGVDKTVAVSYYGANGELESKEITEKVMLDADRIHTVTTNRYDGTGKLLSKKVIEHFYEGTSLVKTVTTNYDGDGNIVP
ncbi:MAG: hypothetical protein J6L85_08220 [Clostridia bacterium]|nr:hypothetical protein [Clostridia bacterium]